MKTLYLECNMGAAGDMLMAALLELHPNPDGFIERLNALGIPGVRVSCQAAVKCGITGTGVQVLVHGGEEHSEDVPHGHTHAGEHAHAGRHIHGKGHTHEHTHTHGGHTHTHGDEHHHSHTGMGEIAHILSHLALTPKVKQDALAVYNLIAEAEAKAHGKPVEQVHFHEVGQMDALADIVGVCMLLEELAPQSITASPVHVGSGQVRCAHGILPVPAPATAHILRGVPTYGGNVQGELCTPTGAALLKYFAEGFGPRPAMATTAIGYGMGKKDFAAANCLRAFLGESTTVESLAPPQQQNENDIIELACNLDDMTGEAIGFALETLLDNGALDVFTIPIGMKKSRPGHMLVCLAAPADEEKMAALLLRHTTTFGVRTRPWHRHILAREWEEQQTEYGPARIKKGTGHGVTKQKAEYEDIARLAKANGLSLEDIKNALAKG